MKTAAAILRIPVSRPDLLFPAAAVDVQPFYRRLASRWHPDRNRAPGATEVFQRIAMLYAAAKKQIAAGRWGVGRRPFELGEMLIGDARVSFVVTPDAADLYASAVRTLRTFPYDSSVMRRQISHCLPQIEAAGPGTLVIKKAPDLVLLADLLEHLDGHMPATQVAWILSSLYNLACWLEWAGITHGAIGPDTVFVSRARQTVALLGGWWYAAPVGTPIAALPARTVEIIPPDIVRDRIADLRCDLELIRATGRELLGDASGARLLRDPSVPRAMADWLRHPSSGSALTDYRLWCLSTPR